MKKAKLGYTYTQIIYMFLVIGFLGFVLENIFRAFTVGVLDSRHMLLPFQFFYGAGVLIIRYAIGTPCRPRFFHKQSEPAENKKQCALRVVLWFLFVFFVLSVGEIIVGEIGEKCFGVHIWDYSDIPLHVTQYTSVPTSLALSALLTFFMGVLFEPIMRLLAKIRGKTAAVLGSVLAAAVVVDQIVAVVYCAVTGNLPVYWSISFPPLIG